MNLWKNFFENKIRSWNWNFDWIEKIRITLDVNEFAHVQICKMRFFGRNVGKKGCRGQGTVSYELVLNLIYRRGVKMDMNVQKTTPQLIKIYLSSLNNCFRVFLQISIIFVTWNKIKWRWIVAVWCFEILELWFVSW